MTKPVLLERVLCLPAIDIAAMLRGQLIVALPKVQIQPGTPCLLAPMWSPDAAPELHYRSPFLPLVETVLHQTQNEQVHLEAWAVCEKTQMVHDAEDLAILSSLTIWSQPYLEKLLQERQHLFLSHLKVHRLSDWIPVPLDLLPKDKEGKVVGLLTLGHQPLPVTEILPIVSDGLFARRKQQLMELHPPEHPELEQLYRAISELTTHDPKAQNFEQELKVFLGWTDASGIKQSDPDLPWISTIADVGNSSDGDLFEKLVRKSLIKLGFKNSNKNSQASLDPNGCGGAGGLDFYCEDPYLVVGECKATKTEVVPDGTPAQLVKLGYKHLQKKYDDCIKIIMAAGELNIHAKQTAQGNKMNVIRPETLQRLVQLKAHHPGAINLLDLKPCLENEPFGQDADDKVNRYIDQIQHQVIVRSHLVNVVKKHLESTNELDAGIDALHGAYMYSTPPQALQREQLRDMLIELSSPLTGYLGRKRGEDGRNRFYFLRDLIVDKAD